MGNFINGHLLSDDEWMDVNEVDKAAFVQENEILQKCIVGYSLQQWRIALFM